MVAADPYVQPERQMEVFKDDLKRLGVLPLYLLVENRGDRELSLDRAAIVLELPDGRQIGRVGAATAAAGRLRPGGPAAGDTAISPVGAGVNLALVPGVDPRAALGVPFLAGLLSIPVQFAVYDAAKREHEARKTEYMNTEFQDVVLNKDASAHGFVYFLPPSGTLWYTKARVALRFVDKTDGTSFVIRVPVNESGLFSDKQGGKSNIDTLPNKSG